jgi:peptidoglycan/xylan/chitin deacetylase (PgdA/CDA1 family)
MLYHRICHKEDYSSPSTISPVAFEGQMAYFAENYQVLPLGELLRCLTKKQSLPEKTVAITFDDGYKDNYLNAYSALKKYHLPATIFLVTRSIGKGGLFWWDKVRFVVHRAEVELLDLGELGSYSLKSLRDRSRAGSAIVNQLKNVPDERKNTLIEKLTHLSGVEVRDELGRSLILSWEEIKEMSRNGIDFGAHSATHPILTNVPLSRARWEVSQSKRDVEMMLGKEVDFFAYPDGNFNGEIVKTVKNCGFAGAVAIGHRWVTPKNSIYRLPRIGATENPDVFRLLLSGLWGDLGQVLWPRVYA